MGRPSLGDLVALRRRPGPPRLVTMITKREAFYEVELTAAPSPVWRGAFLRPPPRVTTTQYTPTIGRVGLTGATVHFRADSLRLPSWLRRIDRWIAYANSVVAE